jgi:hypothetical protein
MKPIVYKNIILAAILLLIVFSCQKPERIVVKGPYIELIRENGHIWGDTTWVIGDTAIIGLKCTWDSLDLIRNINIFRNGDKMGQTINIEPTMGEEFILSLKILKSVVTVEDWIFEVQDTKGHRSELKIKIVADKTGGDIYKINAILGAQSHLSYGSCYSFATDTYVNKNDAPAVSELIDLLAGYDFQEKCYISSPGSGEHFGHYNVAGWNTKNLTQFCLTNLSQEQFSLVENDKLIKSSFNPEKATDLIKNIKPNQIYAFKTQSGRYGLLNIVSEAKSEMGYIVFDYKIQIIPPVE